MAARARGTYGPAELQRDLKKQAPKPVYVLEGEEPLLASEAQQAILDASLPEAGRDFNLNVFSGDDEGSRQFLAQARTYPFLADRRVVLVRRFEKLSLRDRDEAAFLEYLHAPSSSTVLVLLASKLDRRTNVAKALDKAACIVKVDGLEEAQLPAWSRQRLAARGVTASEGASRRLVELAGPGLLEIANEIDKLAARYPSPARIDLAEVDATVGEHRRETVWAINHEFRPDNLSGFWRALGRVLEAENEPVLLLAILARHVNDLLRIQLLVEQGKRTPFALVKDMKRSPWQIEQLLPQARAFTRAQLLLWLANLQRADAQVKSYKLPALRTLERALLNSFFGRELA